MKNKDKDKTFIWSDGWWVEDNNAWFVCGMSNTLFCVDLNTGNCKEAIYIPDPDEHTYRLTPFCLKCGRDIFCIPGIGRSIWIYNLDSKLFTPINIDKPEGLQVMSQFRIWKDVIFIVAVGWNKIIEVSISQKIITNYYTVCEEETVKRSVLVGDNIYITTSYENKVYQFDLVTKKLKEYILPGDKKKLFTICFDGRKFWLSGYKKELYTWEKENSELVTIDNFPTNFEMNDIKADESPLFRYSVAVGGYLWFIPFQANKIIYTDKENAVLSAFEIYDEDETEESIFLRQWWAIPNYLLEYVRDNRYIGLFSAKSARILEIDAQELSYQWKDYYLKDKYFFQCGGYRKLYCEGVDDTLYEMAYRMGIGKIGKTSNSYINRVGKEIHKKMTEG